MSSVSVPLSVNFKKNSDKIYLIERIQCMPRWFYQPFSHVNCKLKQASINIHCDRFAKYCAKYCIPQKCKWFIEFRDSNGWIKKQYLENTSIENNVINIDYEITGLCSIEIDCDYSDINDNLPLFSHISFDASELLLCDSNESTTIQDMFSSTNFILFV
jgi:hypothetical protein